MTLEEALAVFGAVAPDQRFGRWSAQASQALRVLSRVLTLAELREVCAAIEQSRIEGNRRPFDETWRRISAAIRTKPAADVIPIRRK